MSIVFHYRNKDVVTSVSSCKGEGSSAIGGDKKIIHIYLNVSKFLISDFFNFITLVSLSELAFDRVVMEGSKFCNQPFRTALIGVEIGGKPKHFASVVCLIDCVA